MRREGASADSGFAMNIMSVAAAVASCNLSCSTGDQIELSAKEATDSGQLQSGAA